MGFAISAIVRAMQGLLEAAPTILFGILLAGILRTVTGPERLRHAFGGRGWAGMLRASAWGSLIPVCSLGVVPLIDELRRARVPVAQVLAFALAAPMLNPITIMYGFTILEFPVFALIIGSTIIVSCAAGSLTGRWNAVPQAQVGDPPPPPVAWGLRRMANVLLTSARISTGPIISATLLAITVSGLAAACVPEGFLSHHLKYTNPAAPLLMSVIAIPAFVSPATGIMQVAAIAKIQFSLGAAVALHVLGVGLNVATLLWVQRQFGARRLIALLLVTIATTLLVGYAAEAALPHPPGSEDDTHALDVFTQPASADSIGFARTFTTALSQIPKANVLALGVLATLILGGVVVRVAKIPDLQDDPNVNSQAAPKGLNKPLSPRALVTCGVGVLLTTLVLVVYVYYPPIDQLFEDMGSIRANAITAVKTGHPDIAMQELQAWDALAAKLTMSAALRRADIEANASDSARELRQNLAALLAAIREGRKDDSLKLCSDVMRVYDQCKVAFRRSSAS